MRKCEGVTVVRPLITYSCRRTEREQSNPATSNSLHGRREQVFSPVGSKHPLNACPALLPSSCYLTPTSRITHTSPLPLLYRLDVAPRQPQNLQPHSACLRTRVFRQRAGCSHSHSGQGVPHWARCQHWRRLCDWGRRAAQQLCGHAGSEGQGPLQGVLGCVGGCVPRGGMTLRIEWG